MRGYSRYGKGFLFSAEAGISLMVCVSLLAMLSFHAQEDYSEVVVYKQASDFLEVVLSDGSLEERDITHMRSLLSTIGLKGKLSIDNETLFDDQPDTVAVVERTLTDGLSYQMVVLAAGP